MLAALTAALGELGPPASPPARPPARARPLVVEWPQVKAFLAMADTALKAKNEEYEVRVWMMEEREGGRGWANAVAPLRPILAV